jgi:hypothetical protein
LFTKNGNSNLSINAGRISASRINDFGVVGDTKSWAAVRMITYKTLLISPKIKNDKNTLENAILIEK